MTAVDPNARSTASGSDLLPELVAQPPAGPGLFALADLADLDLHVEVPLGSLDVDIRRLLQLRPGSMLRLDRQTGEHLDITVNGTPIARGEIRVHGERFAVRITQILRGVSFDEVEGEARHVRKDSPAD